MIDPFFSEDNLVNKRSWTEKEVHEISQIIRLKILELIN